MRHVKKALTLLEASNPNANYKSFITLENEDDEFGVPPRIIFQVQSDPIGEVGVNGVQAVDMLEYVKYLFVSLNSAFPCRENTLTITKIEEAIHWQEARTKDRLARNVEGKNEA